MSIVKKWLAFKQKPRFLSGGVVTSAKTVDVVDQLSGVASVISDGGRKGFEFTLGESTV